MTLTPLPVDATPTRRLLRALVMCDLVDSTALVEALGDEALAQLMQQHDRMTRSVMQRYDGLEVDRTDGFLLVFESPTAAVEFALDYQRELRALAAECRQSLAARVGLHFGEVVVWENQSNDIQRGARPSEIDGLAIAVVARLVSLALPGQILVSEIAQQIARRADRQTHEGRSRSWKSHGRYTLKGIAEPVAVYEVGEEGFAPMRPPVTSAKASPTTPAWRRPAALAGGGMTLLAIGGIALFLWAHQDVPVSLGERDWIVLGEVVNVNADPTLEAPLAAAFRIGLEESRFVNVVPAGAVRNALSRMQRSGVTRIDREVASEIALREQARGVVVPSIAQYGNSLRVAVELVDPNSIQTVWTQSADAAGTNELLSATDRLLRSLRSRLGESLPRIEATSHPLEKAATPSIEALRAFSRAIRLEGVGDMEQAKRLLMYAISVDADFAAAYARLGAIAYSEQRHADARAALQKALAINDRLSERERVFVSGVLSYYLDPPSMLSAWGLFANLYPQWSNGPHNIGNVQFERLHDYSVAEKSYRSAASLYNPYRNYTYQSLGHVLLAQEKYAEAEMQFRAAIAISPAPMLFGMADALAASGRYEEASKYLNDVPAQAPSAETERSLRRMTLLVRRGQFDDARRVLSELSTPAVAADRWRVMFAALALNLAANDTVMAREMVAKVIREASDPAEAEANLTATEHLLYGAYWAARLRLDDRARTALALAQRRGSFDRFPVRAGLAELVRAQLALNAGRADEARLVLDGSPPAQALWEAHELRAAVAMALGDTAGEAAEHQWLVARPGLAHAQWIDQFVGQQLRSLTLHKLAARPSTLENGAVKR